MAQIVPGEGVEVESGELIRAPIVLSNADPKRTLAMLGRGCRAGRLSRADRRLADGLAGGQAERGAPPAAHVHGAGRRGRAPGDGLDHAGARRRSGGRRGVPARRALDRLRRALLPDRLRLLGGAAGAPHDERLRPIRALRARRGRLGRRGGRRSGSRSSTRSPPTRPTSAIASSTSRCSGRPTSSAASASPAVTSSRGRRCRSRCGTAGSTTRTPVQGLYLCGAATHPAGSVIALNGRNAAMAALEDAGG